MFRKKTISSTFCEPPIKNTLTPLDKNLTTLY